MGWFSGAAYRLCACTPDHCECHDDSKAALQRHLHCEKSGNESTRDEGGTRQQPWIKCIQGSRWCKTAAAKLDEKEWLSPTPTEANFVLCRVKGFDAKSVAAVLGSHDVMVRFFGSQGGALERYIRVSVGTPRDMERFHSALDLVPQESNLVKDFSMSNKQVKALIFDMDGVLADVKASYRAAIIQTCKYFGVTITNDDINKIKAKGDANNDWVVSHRLIASTNKAVQYEDVKSKFQELYLGGLRDTETLIPDKQMLLNLAKQYPCAIVTGRPREDCDYFLKLVGLDQAFTTCVCMEDTRKPKPDPAPVQLALKLLGISGVSDTNGSRSDAIYMFGDTVDDVRASTGSWYLLLWESDCQRAIAGDARTLACAGADVVLDAGMDALNVFRKTMWPRREHRRRPNRMASYH